MFREGIRARGRIPSLFLAVMNWQPSVDIF